MADQQTVTEILEAAHQAMDDAGIPADLKAVAFGKAVDLLAGGRAAKPGQSKPEQSKPERETPSESPQSLEAFFAQHPGGKPSENAFAIASYFYSQYGDSPFSYEEVRDVATEVGLTLPERIDMTLGAAKRGPKSLFKSAGRGRLRPTVHGETWMKDEYNIKKGTKKKPD